MKERPLTIRELKGILNATTILDDEFVQFEMYDGKPTLHAGRGRIFLTCTREMEFDFTIPWDEVRACLQAHGTVRVAHKVIHHNRGFYYVSGRSFKTINEVMKYLKENL